jgi:flagellum-specific ATP synthase
LAYDDVYGLVPGASVIFSSGDKEVKASLDLLGRVVNGFGAPIDGGPRINSGDSIQLYRQPPNPLTRRPISQVLDVGVRVINTLLTIGKGQRLGIMAGSGVGKSTLLGMIAKYAASDVNVIALVGERGREVREFIERDLGAEGKKRSVVVVATGDTSPLERLRAAFLATAYAEFFRDQGKKVILMMDSVTRLAMAQREIGLAIGEPPSTKGYTPSVFSMLPKLLERAGNCSGEGSITGLYTTLVEGDDMNEPIADAVRGILDGHIVLSRKLAGRGHFPAVEVLESVSRVVRDIVPSDALNLAQMVREVLATYKDTEDLITIGAYKPGQNKQVDRAVSLYEPLIKFLIQAADSKSSMEESWQHLVSIFSKS